MNTASGIVFSVSDRPCTPDGHLQRVTIPGAVLTLILLTWRIG